VPAGGKMIDFFQNVDPGKSGGKGRNLIALTKASFPVPPGFIVTYDGYRSYRESGRMSEELKRKVSAYYRQLCRETGGRFVSVRSSASAEDLKAASFAGQYDTFLYVHSEEELFARIVDCWNSLYSERATAYRERMKIPAADLQMAVVVQAMIDPRSAGILFTEYSYAGKKKVMVVESAWGCGETVVSGKVTPDHFVVSRDESFTLLETLPGNKDIQLRGGDSGPVEMSVPAGRKESDSLTGGELARLCSLGKKIEDIFGRPQDIEWALDDNGAIFILQSRPVTK